MNVQTTGNVPWGSASQRIAPATNSSSARASSDPRIDGGVSAPGSPAIATPATNRQLQQALSDLQNVIDPLAHDLQFSVDEESGRTIVKVVDRATDEVVTQFPSEQALHMSRTVKEYLQGLLVDKNA